MTDQPSIHVACEPVDGGWSCLARVGDDLGATRHRVSVSAEDLTRLASADAGPDVLVEASFAFLLEREPRESILRAFDLMIIGRYFPDFEREIQRRLRPGD